MDHDRLHLMERYRASQCEIFSDGGWRRWEAVPDRELIAVSAWNPHAIDLPVEQNLQRDRRLRRYLRNRGLFPLRIRGRSPGEVPEEGWMIPHLAARSVKVLLDFGQAAGLIYGPDFRAVLWADGTTNRLDGPPLLESAVAQPMRDPAIP